MKRDIGTMVCDILTGRIRASFRKVVIFIPARSRRRAGAC